MRPSGPIRALACGKRAEQGAEPRLGDPAGVVVRAPLDERPGDGRDLAEAAGVAGARAEADLDGNVLARAVPQPRAEGGLGLPGAGAQKPGAVLRMDELGTGPPDQLLRLVAEQTASAGRCGQTHAALVIAGDQLGAMLRDEPALGLRGSERRGGLVEPAPKA